jgi:hypothetical protein
MSWLKSLKFKRVLNLFSRDSSQTERRFRFGVRWNQTTKVFAGLVASVCSMMALISFFGSLEQPSSLDSELSKAESLAPDLGSSDELSQEFGLDAELPLQEAVADAEAAMGGVQTVSVEQAVDSGATNSGVYHAVGREYGNRQTSGRVEPVSGSQPIYVPGVRQSGGSQGASSSGAAWLTGDIEELEQLPTVRSMAVPPRNY